MNAAAALRFEPAGEGAWAAAGALTFATARAARLAGLGALQGVPQGLRIDCAGVTSADSAGLAVLLDWLAAAQLAGRHLKFTGLPPGLTALATISEVSELLARGV